MLTGLSWFPASSLYFWFFSSSSLFSFKSVLRILKGMTVADSALHGASEELKQTLRSKGYDCIWTGYDSGHLVVCTQGSMYDVEAVIEVGKKAVCDLYRIGPDSVAVDINYPETILDEVPFKGPLSITFRRR